MANSTMEIDFFQSEKFHSSLFSGVQKAVSRINPDLMKTAMTPSSSKYSCSPRISISSETAPLTIFYNGTVAAFHLPRDTAEAIIKMAERGATESQIPEEPYGDLPIARNKSLRRFLEKRKERCKGTATSRPHLRMP